MKRRPVALTQLVGPDGELLTESGLAIAKTAKRKRRRHFEDGHASATIPANAEEKARVYANQLVADGWEPACALHRARAAYGLARWTDKDEAVFVGPPLICAQFCSARPGEVLP